MSIATIILIILVILLLGRVSGIGGGPFSARATIYGGGGLGLVVVILLILILLGRI